MGRRKKRTFTKEQKEQAVALVRENGGNVTMTARELDLTESTLRTWVKQAEIDGGGGPAGALTTDEKKELARLRRENRRLRMERDFLKKATAFFARDSSDITK
jgi:transposase